MLRILAREFSIRSDISFGKFLASRSVRERPILLSAALARTALFTFTAGSGSEPNSKIIDRVSSGSSRRFTTQRSKAKQKKMVVETKAHENNSPAQVIDFLQLVQNLKVTKREGWVRMGVNSPESIADHMYRMSLMALVAPRDMGVDIDRCIKLAIAHDIAEAIVGDITPCCGVSKEEKNRLETEAIHRIKDLLGSDSIAGVHVQELWQEYEDAQTPEAQLVKDFDKIEMILQAHEYEGMQAELNLQEFFDSTKGRFKTELGRSWAEEIVRRRNVSKSTKS